MDPLPPGEIAFLRLIKEICRLPGGITADFLDPYFEDITEAA
jgi:hypothetical protein